MAEILLFHHAQGLTQGCIVFADELRAAGHLVHTPDLYAGKTFSTLDEGVAHADQVGFGAVIERGVAVAGGLPNEIVYAGFSLGVLPAQRLAQTRRGAKGAVFFHSTVAPAELGGPWPEGVPLQIHMMEGDSWALPPNEDLKVARELARTVEGVELFLYPGDRHLFADSSLPEFDEDAARLATQRVLGFLGKVG